MMTEVLKVNPDSLMKAASLLKQGELVGIPTETVYGLAANGLNTSAVNTIFKVKGRPQDNPLILHINSFEMLQPLVREIPQIAISLADKFWGGPLTMIFPKSEIVSDSVSAGLDTVAIRMPAKESTLELIRLCGFPLAAPSANLSGKPSPTSANHVFHDLNGKVPLILDDGDCNIGVESTVICFKENSISILRPGGITKEMLEQYAPVVYDPSVFASYKTKRPSSPGMKYKHYSPKANVVLVTTDDDTTFLDYVYNQNKTSYFALTYSQNLASSNVVPYGTKPEQQAKNIFRLLRELDEKNPEVIYIRTPNRDDLGAAVYNRLLRASGFQEIQL